MDKKVLFISLVLSTIVSISAFATTIGVVSGYTDGGVNKVKIYAEGNCDGNDNVFSADDLDLTTKVGSYIKCTVVGTLYYTGGSKAAPKNAGYGSIKSYVSLSGTGQEATLGTAKHTLESTDFGSWSSTNSSSF